MKFCTAYVFLCLASVGSFVHANPVDIHRVVTSPSIRTVWKADSMEVVSWHPFAGRGTILLRKDGLLTDVVLAEDVDFGVGHQEVHAPHYPGQGYMIILSGETEGFSTLFRVRA